MFRMWGKIFKQNRLIQDTVICIDDETLSRTAKVFQAVNDKRRSAVRTHQSGKSGVAGTDHNLLPICFMCDKSVF